MSTPNLTLPLLAAAQAQKHVTHNEALEILDAVVQLTVQAFDATTPPTSPSEGQVWALGASPTGAWAGQGNKLAAYYNGGWIFVTPRAGWRATLGTEIRVWSGSAWVAPSFSELQNLPLVGINTTADTTNRLVVSSPAVLFTHNGAGHQLKINKATITDTASVLFQTGFSGRAEFGLAGTDDWSVKVSPDGTTWYDVLTADRNTGAVTLSTPLAITSGGTGATTAAAARTNLGLGTAATADVTTSANDTTAGRVTRVGDFGLGTFACPDVNPDASDLATRIFRSTTVPVLGGPAHTIHISRVQNAQSAQIAIRDSTASVPTTMAIRHRDSSGTWAEWHYLYGRLNILGAVSQSGGVPTGAVIQRGSNSNGEFVRFADGTQICTHSVSIALAIDNAFIGGFRSAAQIWTYPAAFAAVPSVSVCALNLTAFGAISAGPPGTSSMQWAVTAVLTQASATREVALVAIGRWF